MSKLNVPGIDPARIECRKDVGCSRVYLDGCAIATLDSDGPVFDGCWDRGDVLGRDSIAVMNAVIDHWRATGRLFPEPPPEPVECVCGGKAKVRIDGEFMFCSTVSCHLRSNTVEQWNTMQAALKAAKEGKS